MYYPLHFSQLFFEHLIQFFFQAIFIYPTIFLRYELWLCFKCPSLSFVSLLLSYFTNNNSFLQASMDPWLELTDGLTWSTGEWHPLLSALLLSPLLPAQSSRKIFVIFHENYGDWLEGTETNLEHSVPCWWHFWFWRSSWRVWGKSLSFQLSFTSTTTDSLMPSRQLLASTPWSWWWSSLMEYLADII